MSEPPAKPVWKRALHLTLPLIATFGAIELAARLLLDPPPPPRSVFELTMSEPDEVRIWRYKPNHRQRHRTDEFDVLIETRDWGLRDEDPRPSDEIRVLAIGDSFTFGWGVDEPDRYSERLEELLLEALPGVRVRVINAGHWFYTFDQHLLLAKELVPRLEPDVVVHGVYARHSLTIHEHSLKTDENGRIEGVRFESSNNEIVVDEEGTLRRTTRLIDDPPLGSRFLAKFFQRYYRWKQRREVMVLDAALFDPSDTTLSEAWAKTRRALRELSEYLEERRVAYIPFEIPLDAQLDDSEWKQWLVKASANREIDLQLPHTRLAEVFEGTEANWLPLLDRFKAEYRSDLYFPDDTHWTAEGHRLAARLVAPAVLEALGAPRTEHP